MTLRVIIYRLGVIPLLLLLCILAACSQQDLDQEEQGMVSLKVLASPGTKAGEGGTATATLPAKETVIFDLSIFIFNSNGDVIGFTSKDFSDGKPTAVVVKTRKATGCSVYAIANAKTLNNGESPFDGVSTLSVFKAKYLSFADANAPNNANCLLMMGVSSNFDTSSAGSATITLKRLASRIDYTITVNNDYETKFPIVVDSYQLCNVPNATFYTHDDMANPTLPDANTYQNFSEQKTPVNSWDPNPTVSYEQYVYANPAKDETHATYLLIKAHAQASSSNTAKIWESVFKVYLKEVKQGGAPMTTQYQILPNYHYTVNITIKGSKVTADNGVECTAYPFFSSGNPDKNLDDWIDGQEKIDFDYEEK